MLMGDPCSTLLLNTHLLLQSNIATEAGKCVDYLGTFKFVKF